MAMGLAFSGIYPLIEAFLEGKTYFEGIFRYCRTRRSAWKRGAEGLLLEHCKSAH